MPIYRLQVAAAINSALPRDRIVNTLWFNDHGATTNPTNLCSDLASVFESLWYGASGPPELDVRAYSDPQDGGPPDGRFVKNTGNVKNAAGPREVALCLSFYSGTNQPRKRGRIYLPVAASTQTGMALRPTTGQMTAALDLGDAFASLGGVDVDWIVKSDLAGGGGKVSNMWVDDEWDTQRRRGLKATTRQTRSTGG